MNNEKKKMISIAGLPNSSRSIADEREKLGGSMRLLNAGFPCEDISRSAKGFIDIQCSFDDSALIRVREQFKDLMSPKCQCGTDKVHGPQSSAQMHSEWCPKNNVFKCPIIGDGVSEN